MKELEEFVKSVPGCKDEIWLSDATIVSLFALRQGDENIDDVITRVLGVNAVESDETKIWDDDNGFNIGVKSETEEVEHN